jgi:GTP-binding protein Era
MIAVSFDATAQTLYWYFTEIVAGAVVDEGESHSALLLDDNGQIIGIELELDETISPTDLTMALGHPQASYEAKEYRLTLKIADEEPFRIQPLSEAATLDFDAAGSLLGCEVYPSSEFELATRIERLAPFLIALDDNQEDQEADEPDDNRTLPMFSARSTDPADLPPTAEPDVPFRSGFVALVGRPNVGKSTLLNAMLGQKVAIVSPKPQTTRIPMRGILNRADAQVIFVDTPGIHTPKNRLGDYMVDQARRAIPDADVVCFMVDITAPPGKLDERIAALVRRSRAPKLLVLNKVDTPHRDGADHLMAYRALGNWDMEIAISALKQKGIETLLDEIVRRLPTGVQLYPDGQITDQSVRERAAELVREQVLRLTDKEVPHGVAVEVEEWETKERALYIRMTIYVEKESQKGILIGAKGTMLKQIGSRARPGIEQVVGQTVYLELWVKSRPNWRDDPSSLGWLGYRD